MGEDILKQLSKKLDVLIKLSAAIAIRDQVVKDQIHILSRAGFKPREIAKVVGKSPNYVRVMLSHIRRGGKKR